MSYPWAMATPTTPDNRVIGTIVTPHKKDAFIYHVDEDRLELDFVFNPTQVALPDDRRAELERSIRRAVDDDVTEVRFGQYHCYDCGKWIVLDGTRWSLGMCFNCSFDRSSEIADRD